MTTIEIIFTLALLAGFVGFVIDMERRAARENKDTSPDDSITIESVKEVLHKIGVKKMEPQQGKNIAFNYQNCLYGLEFTDQPAICLGFLCTMEDSFDIELAKKAADDCNRTIGNIKVEIDDDRSCAFGCMTFADDIDTLSAALPHMILYLEQGRVAFLQFYQKNLSEKMNALLPSSPIKS